MLINVPNIELFLKEEIVDVIIQAHRVAELTGAPIGTVRYWDSVGTGPTSFKLNGRRVWRESVVLAWIAEQEQATRRGGGDAA